jgi:hypothetical protein
MNSQRDALAADLAADLLADLAPQPDPTIEPTRSRAQRPGPGPTPGPAPAGPRTRGPAVQTLLRFQPLDWYRPLLSVERRSLAVRLGPVYAQLSLRPV